MTQCRFCDREVDATALVRHERGGLLLVHCPSCKHVLGVYKRHGGRF